MLFNFDRTELNAYGVKYQNNCFISEVNPATKLGVLEKHSVVMWSRSVRRVTIHISNPINSYIIMKDKLKLQTILSYTLK